MLKYIIKRLLWIIPVLFGVAIVVFTILYFSPGDPAYLALGDNATPEAVEAYRIEMGIDGTYWERLGRLLTGMLHGDLGLSSAPNAVMDELLVRFKVTFNISAWSIVLGIILGIFFGIVSALKQNSIWDTLSTGCALFGISMPMFWQGLMLILIFSVWLDWLPASGYGTWQQMIMPVIALGVNSSATIMRTTRSSHGGGHAAGLHPHGQGQGPDLLGRGAAPRSEKRHDPYRHGHRTADEHCCWPAPSSRRSSSPSPAWASIWWIP